MPNATDQRQDSELYERVLRAFEARARDLDSPGVRMSDLAKDLGISTKTLYRVVDGKDALVAELMRRWIREQEQEEQARRRGEGTPLEKILVSVESWAVGTRFSPVFLAEVERDHPHSWELFQQARRATRARWSAFLEPYIRDDADFAIAVEAFDAIVRRVLDPQTQERLGLEVRDALRRAIGVWAHGALAQEAARSS